MDYEYASISADEIMKYASHIKNNYSEEQKEKLYDIISYLEKVFPEKGKMLKKINVPIIMLIADTAMGSDYDSVKSIYRVGPMYFRQWFSYFFNECYEGYKQYCSSGSIKKEKTLKRIEVMESSFIKYFELEEIAEPEQDEQISPLSEENPGLQEESVPASAAEDPSFNTVSGNAETGTPTEEDKPSEEVNHDTE